MLNTAGPPVSARAPSPRAEESAHHEEPDSDYDDGLLRSAVPIVAIGYALALGILLLTFDSDTEAFFAVVVATGIFLASFFLPFVALHNGHKRDERWHGQTQERTAQDVATWTGTLSRKDALAQIIVIPLALSVTFICFALIWILEGP